MKMYALKETNGDWYIKSLRPFSETQYPSEALKFGAWTDADETMYLYGLDYDYEIVECFT